MALPSFNLTAKNVPADKQMSMMRTYLAQLKDETETELYDIKWDNLSQSLRKRIEDLDAYVNQVNDYSQMTAQVIKANVIDANLVTADKVRSIIGEFDFVTTSVLQAQVAIINDVLADKVTANQVKSIIGEFNYVTAGTVRSIIGEFGFITSEYINSTHISAAYAGAQSARFNWINTNTIKVYSGIAWDVADRTLSFTPTSMNGYYVLAAPQPRGLTQADG